MTVTNEVIAWLTEHSQTTESATVSNIKKNGVGDMRLNNILRNKCQ